MLFLSYHLSSLEVPHACRSHTPSYLCLTLSYASGGWCSIWTVPHYHPQRQFPRRDRVADNTRHTTFRCWLTARRSNARRCSTCRRLHGIAHLLPVPFARRQCHTGRGRGFTPLTVKLGSYPHPPHPTWLANAAHTYRCHGGTPTAHTTYRRSYSLRLPRAPTPATTTKISYTPGFNTVARFHAALDAFQTELKQRGQTNGSAYARRRIQLCSRHTITPHRCFWKRVRTVLRATYPHYTAPAHLALFHPFTVPWDNIQPSGFSKLRLYWATVKTCFPADSPPSHRDLPRALQATLDCGPSSGMGSLVGDTAFGRDGTPPHPSPLLKGISRGLATVSWRVRRVRAPNGSLPDKLRTGRLPGFAVAARGITDSSNISAGADRYAAVNATSPAQHLATRADRMLHLAAEQGAGGGEHCLRRCGRHFLSISYNLSVGFCCIPCTISLTVWTVAAV